MSSRPKYLYLNNDSNLFVSKLAQELARAQARAPVKQWMAFIKGLSTKGVKGSEIEDAKILPHLEAMQDSAMVEKEELLKWLKSSFPTIKEFEPSRHSYSSYAHSRNPGETYHELLYILNSEQDNMDDRLAEIRFELEELDFDLTRLAADPMLAVRLYEEQQSLTVARKNATPLTFNHWGGVIDPDTKEQVANMLAHARVSVRNGLYFIEEIQSDWAQRGRKAAISDRLEELNAIAYLSKDERDLLSANARENKGNVSESFLQAHSGTDTELGRLMAIPDRLAGYLAKLAAPLEWKRIPSAPWVTNTELWAGLILRRQLQRAAQNPQIREVAWIRSSMRNGGGFGDSDGLENFYHKIMPKLADKVLSGTGEKTKFIKVTLGKTEYEVPGIQMTDKVRAKMLESQPLYSRDVVTLPRQKLSDNDYAALNRMLRKAHEMLGNAVSIRLAKRLVDAAGADVAGSQEGRFIDVSMGASNPAQALSHEVWHYADRHLLSSDDRQSLDRAFADGALLNLRVRESLVREQANPQALAQCSDPKEAAAYGFSLWMEGKFALTKQEAIKGQALGSTDIDRTVGKVFRKVEMAFAGMAMWVRRVLGETQQQKAERRAAEVFQKLRDGLIREGAELPEHEEPVSDEVDVGQSVGIGSYTTPRMRA